MAQCLASARCAAAPGRRASSSPRQSVRVAVAMPTNMDVTRAVDATLDVIQSSIEHLKSSFEAEAQQQPAAPATTLTSAPAEQPSAISEGRRWIGELQPDGSILFQSLDTCCGHVVSQEADGTTTFHFD